MSIPRTRRGFKSLEHAESSQDDWRGVVDLAERRRIQNRLAQRNYRRKIRRRLEALDPAAASAGGTAKQPSPSPSSSSTSSNAHAPQSHTWAFSESSNSLDFASTSSGKDTWVEPELLPPLPSNNALEESRSLNLQSARILDAVKQNAALIGVAFPDLFNPVGLSPFYKSTQTTWGLPQSPPPELKPTALQVEIPHHPCIDVIPFPQFRDRILGMLPMVNEMEIFYNILSEWKVWGKLPWSGNSWEVGQVWFDRHWYWMDSAMLTSTNFYRGQRGELLLETERMDLLENEKRIPTIPALNL